ncbi:MAG TPA: hemolysin family protein, partial [Solirubrobacteraceae bacterium]|nr:hemolysin family protein [Solirubrobacteraceae bacterium]
MTTALLLLAVLVLILLNAFFVAAEFALVRSRKAHLESMADEGKRGASVAVRLMDDLSRYLSAVQVAITLTSLGIGFIGEPAVGRIFENVIGENVSHNVRYAISFALAYLITTSLHIVFGEQVPKLYAIQKAETMARVTSRPLYLFARGVAPFVAALNAATNGVLRLLGLRTSGQLDDAESPEELRVLIQESVTGGKLDPGEAGMLTGVFHLHEQQARQVMTPAPAVVTVDLSEDVETAVRRCVSSGHTRLVVTEDDNADRVRGIVHTNQLSQRLLADG